MFRVIGIAFFGVALAVAGVAVAISLRGEKAQAGQQNTFSKGAPIPGVQGQGECFGCTVPTP